jgi:DinB superfamily
MYPGRRGYRSAMDWGSRLLEQLTHHWENQARPRLDGLTDDEYLWEPVPGTWSLRPRAEATAAMAAGAGEWVLDFELPQPDPAPVTTIAWRLGHVIVGIFGARNAAHFGGPPVDYPSHLYAGTAGEALAQLDDGYARWVAGVRGLDEDALARPIGEAEGPFAELPYAALVLHINREVIHHLAEVALLRDLYTKR